MSSLLAAIVPKSDQLNADDLLSGPRTITITDVTVKSGEQPVSIHFEGDGKKPYKPCKSMCRVMVQLWGPDGKAYVGKSMTLYTDPDVKFGGMTVGGIRISHMSHITAPMTLMLTSTRSKKAPHVVKPLVDAPNGKAVPAKPKKTARERGAAMVEAFAPFHVSQAMIEANIGHPIDEITDADLDKLTVAFKAIKGGGDISNHFVEPEPQRTETIDDSDAITE